MCKLCGTEGKCYKFEINHVNKLKKSQREAILGKNDASLQAEDPKRYKAVFSYPCQLNRESSSDTYSRNLRKREACSGNYVNVCIS